MVYVTVSRDVCLKKDDLSTNHSGGFKAGRTLVKDVRYCVDVWVKDTKQNFWIGVLATGSATHPKHNITSGDECEKNAREFRRGWAMADDVEFPPGFEVNDVTMAAEAPIFVQAYPYAAPYPDSTVQDRTVYPHYAHVPQGDKPPMPPMPVTIGAVPAYDTYEGPHPLPVPLPVVVHNPYPDVDLQEDTPVSSSATSFSAGENLGDFPEDTVFLEVDDNVFGKRGKTVCENHTKRQLAWLLTHPAAMAAATATLVSEGFLA